MRPIGEAMSGMRDFVQNRQREKNNETVLELGTTTGKESPCHLYQKDWKVCGIAHGDDLRSSAKKATWSESPNIWWRSSRLRRQGPDRTSRGAPHADPEHQVGGAGH